MFQKILFSLLIALSCYCISLQAQNKSGNNMQDVVYLKNGGLIRGTISVLIPDEKVAIVSVGGNVFVYEMSEVDSIAREEIPFERQNRSANYRKKGPFYALEAGFLAGDELGNDGWKTRALQQITGGYMFHPRIGVGAGVALVWYESSPIIPVFLQVRGNLSKQALTSFYYFADVGYGIPTNRNETLQDVKGGIKSAAGLGLKVSGRNDIGWTLSVGYHLQKAQTTQNYWDWEGIGSQSVRSLSYRKLEIKTGVWF